MKEKRNKIVNFFLERQFSTFLPAYQPNKQAFL